ncbi:MAG: stage II sporulation protein R [Clostridia bacterium]|nr:stage II sporulation protein R [Clostridia bacterium]
MKLLFKSFCCAVVISCVLSMTGFCSACENIEDKVFRLHIIANSDSEEDQALKLKVRDEITAYTDELFKDCNNKQESMQKAKDNINKIRAKAQEVVNRNGFDQKVDAYVTNMSFDTRVYDDFTLPAGKYDALRIVIGEGEGHNWWCVLYPAVCVPSAEKNIGSALNESETDIVTESDKYVVKFKIVELWEELFCQ